MERDGRVEKKGEIRGRKKSGGQEEEEGKRADERRKGGEAKSEYNVG